MNKVANRVSVGKGIIASLIRGSCTSISPDVFELLKKARDRESFAESASIMDCMIDNVKAAGEAWKPVCQSPGYPVVYVRFGENADLSNIPGDFREELVSATKEGLLRPSIVHPLTRKNPGDNSGVNVPNFEFQFEPGRRDLEIIVSFKGCGAELGNVFKTMTTAELKKDYSGLKKLVLSAVAEAGGKPCPPTGIGVGIGGQMDQAARLSREAISTRNWSDINPDPMLADLEAELLEKINALGLGAAGIGGDTYCLALKIGMASTHTAICPVAINFHCWVARRSGIRILEDGRTEIILGKEV